MAFWDNFSQKASETTAKAVQKAKNMADIARINASISDEETKINNTYYQIGKLYVTMHPHDYEEDFAGMVASLAESEENIKRYRQQIQDIKGIVRCPQCGAEVQSGVAFCSSCGAPMPQAQTINTDDMIRCENCGAMIKKGVRFCTSCGSPMVQLKTPEVSDTPVENVSQENDDTVCPNCGAKIESDVAFCTECGTKL